MTPSDKLREIADMWGFRIVAEDCDDPNTEFETIDDSNKLFSDLTALIGEGYYPKEFLLWTHSQDYWLFNSLTCLWVSDEPKAFQEEKTTDELFNYWTNNVKQ